MSTALLEDVHLSEGAHASPREGMCFLEAVAYIAGEEFSDHPPCVCPVLAAFGRNWNDHLDDETRQRLRPYIPRMIGTAADGRSEWRAWMCLDWLSRDVAPAFLELTPALKTHADALRALPEICDKESLAVAMPVLAAARAAAWAVAWAAAWDAAGTAAGDAAGAAAWDAAGATAGDAAGAAAWATAWATAWAAAGTAAGDAAGAAAWDAAWERLMPTTKWLQESAFALLDRMLPTLATQSEKLIVDANVNVRNNVGTGTPA